MKNKVVCITGAARGIGAGMARYFAEKNYDLILHYHSSKESAEQLKKDIQKEGQNIYLIQADVSKSNEVEKMFSWIKENIGHLDCLINNSGACKDGLMIRMSEKDFMDVIDVNLKGCFLCSKEAVKIMMKQRSGSIINLSSIVGVCGNAGQSNYAASKAGILGLTKSLAKEIASRSIRVNAIAPGFIQTSMTDKLSESIKEAMSKQIPLRTLGTVDDVARVAYFLASEESRYMTGQVLHVDGGLWM